MWKLIYSYNDYIAFLVQIPRKCLGGKKLMIFRVWEAFYSAPSAFSTVSVDTFHKLWKLSEFFFLKSWGRQWYEKGTLKPAEWPGLISSFLKQWFTMRELDLKRGFTWKSEIFASFVTAMVFIRTIADYTSLESYWPEDYGNVYLNAVFIFVTWYQALKIL